MTYASQFLRVVPAGIALGIALSCAPISLAQSGRRARKPAPAPVATPEPTPAPTKPVDKEKTTITFLVGMDRYNGFSTIPLQYYDTAARACSDRLDEAPGVKSDAAHGEMNRREAIEAAKASKTGYVVLLQLKVENINPDPTIVNQVDQLYLEYSVFEPTTAKVVAWGHTYQGARRKGVLSGPSPTGRGNTVYTEYLLKQAARDAAERILDALKVNMGRQMPRGVIATSVPRLRTVDRSGYDIFRR